MPLRLRSAGGGSVQLNPPVATSTDVVMEVPAYDGAKVLTNKTPGTVLQVVQAIKQDTQTINSTSFVDVDGLSVTITPSSASSKILVLCNVSLGAQNEGGLRVVRNGSLFLGSLNGTAPSGNFATSVDDGPAYSTSSAVSMLLDSPASTSPVTYKVQAATLYGTGRLCFINQYPASWPTYYSAGTVSTITLMEIAA